MCCIAKGRYLMQIDFSATEIALIQNMQFFELRKTTEPKIIGLLNGIRDRLLQISIPYSPLYPLTTDSKMGKISKGENYLGFPYRLIDFPRLFTRHDMFACRNMFLWGHHFAFHLLMAGPAMDTPRKRLSNRVKQLIPLNLMLCTHETPWQWEFNPIYNMPIDDSSSHSVETMLLHAPFIKISKYWPLHQYKHFLDQSPILWQQIQPLLFSEL